MAWLTASVKTLSEGWFLIVGTLPSKWSGQLLFLSAFGRWWIRRRRNRNGIGLRSAAVAADARPRDLPGTTGNQLRRGPNNPLLPKRQRRRGPAHDRERRCRLARLVGASPIHRSVAKPVSRWALLFVIWTFLARNIKISAFLRSAP